jgi:hypothetical protein
MNQSGGSISAALNLAVYAMRRIRIDYPHYYRGTVLGT